MDHLYTILLAFAIGASAGYFLVNAAALLRNRPFRIQRLLAFIFIYWAAWTMKDLPMALPEIYHSQYRDYVFVADGWTAIAFAVLVFELSERGWLRWWKFLLLSLPFAAFTLGYILTQSKTLLTAYGCFLTLFGIVVIIVGSYRIYKYMQYVRSEYSNLENISLSWFWGVLFLFAISQLMWLIVSVTSTRFADLVYYAMTIVFWEATLVHCRRLRPVLVPKEEVAESGKTVSFAFADRFEKLVLEEKAYLDKDLRLEDLARRLGTNRTYVSSYFREVLKSTFYDYINRLRITEAALPLMSEHPEYKLEHIAAESGFKSISTFRRAFRKVTGSLPSEHQL